MMTMPWSDSSLGDQPQSDSSPSDHALARLITWWSLPIKPILWLPRVHLVNILLFWLAPGIFDIDSGAIYGDRTQAYSAISQDLQVTSIWVKFIKGSLLLYKNGWYGKSRSTMGASEFIFPHK
ncbi:hypothetical protein Dsin_013765 [Dipteronia sinensis]|uniref:Uncharacterized protein n=1 Tax=Dipteronia sinensis TaxID=43782 RepID=A0AAE0ALK2_9ROSI|nr:hypothetical protein Dsin_013765 [Dipteronia sinensis]